MLRILSVRRHGFTRTAGTGKHLLCLYGKFCAVLRIFIPFKRILFAEEFSLRTRNFKSVCARSFPCRSNEHARRAVFIAKIRGNFILDLDIVPFPVTTESAHKSGLFAHHPGNEVELMRTLVDEHSTSFPRPSRAPAARLIIEPRAVPIGDNPSHAL